MSSFTFANADDFKAWLAENKAVISGILTPAQLPPAPTRDAAQVRQVTDETITAVTAPPKPATRLAPKETMFTQPDQTGTNAIRLVVGRQAPRHTINRFGYNSFIPDFTMLHILLNTMALMLNDCKRFFDQSSFFHPMLAHVYMGIVAPIAVFRAMREQDTLPAAQTIWLEQFEKKWPASSLPIPGPIVNILQLLAVSKPGLEGFHRISPFLPDTPRSHNNSFGTAFHGNQNTPDLLSGRIASVPALLDQYARLLTFITTPVAGNLPDAAQISQWSAFGHTICGTQALAAVPAHVAEQQPIVNGLNAVRSNVFNSPGFTTPTYCSNPIASNLRNNAARVIHHFPPAAAANNVAHTWDTFFRLNHRNGQWFTDLCEIMCLFSSHFSGSRTLQEIGEIGNTGGQVVFTHAGALQPAAPSRFPDTTITCSGLIRTPVVADSDLFDACVGLVNRDIRIAGIVDNNNELTTGPIWTAAAGIEDVNEVSPVNGAQVIIRNNYYISMPKQNIA